MGKGYTVVTPRDKGTRKVYDEKKRKWIDVPKLPKYGGGAVTPVGSLLPLLDEVKNEYKRRKKQQKKRKKLSDTNMGVSFTGHNDITIKSIGSVNVGRQYKRKTDARASYNQISQHILNGPASTIIVAQGRQCVDYLECMMTGSWLKGIANVNRNDRFNLPDSIYDFDSATAPTSGVTNATTRVYDRNKFHMKHIICNYGFLSMSTVPQILEVYWITPTFDQFVDPIALLGQIMSFQGDGQVASSNATTIATLSATPGAASWDNWGFDPWKVKEFRKAFKILKKTKMTLNPGDQRHIKLKINWNKTYNKEEFVFATYGRNRDWLKGITVIPFCVLRAGLVGATNVEGTESREVVYAQPKVGVSCSQMIVSGLLPIANRMPFQRVHKGMLEATTEILREIDDNDDVEVPEKK